jgi:hypothetical protein
VVDPVAMASLRFLFSGGAKPSNPGPTVKVRMEGDEQ